MVGALAQQLPEAVVRGSAVGLFLTLALPGGVDEARFVEAPWRRGVVIDRVNEHATAPRPPGVAIGFACVPEPTIRFGIRLLAEAHRELA